MITTTLTITVNEQPQLQLTAVAAAQLEIVTQQTINVGGGAPHDIEYGGTAFVE